MANGKDWLLLKAHLVCDFGCEVEAGRTPDWESYLRHSPKSEDRVNFLSDLIQCELGHKGWPRDLLEDRIRLFLDHGASKTNVLDLLREAFAVQCDQGEKPLFSDFEGFGFSADELRLQSEDELFYLGLVIPGRWRLEQRVGKGEFGIVYRARDLNTNGTVAIKEFRDATAMSRLHGSLLVEELSTLSQLRHRNICRFLEAITLPEGQVIAFVYQFVEGQTLRDVLHNGRVAPDRSARIAAKLADALDYTHQAGFLHRDVKPENVLVDADFEPHLTDFGMVVRAGSQFDIEGVAGTPSYMAPEVVQRQSTRIDGRSDIWSLGAILFELLTGERLIL